MAFNRNLANVKVITNHVKTIHTSTACEQVNVRLDLSHNVVNTSSALQHPIFTMPFELSRSPTIISNMAWFLGNLM
jgi:hypothetical protein